jgi:hypothetical protein
MADLYRQKVTTLAEALEHPETRSEASGALRGLRGLATNITAALAASGVISKASRRLVF